MLVCEEWMKKEELGQRRAVFGGDDSVTKRKTSGIEHCYL